MADGTTAPQAREATGGETATNEMAASFRKFTDKLDALLVAGLNIRDAAPGEEPNHLEAPLAEYRAAVDEFESHLL